MPEEQSVLEHHRDRTLLGRHEHARGRVVEHHTVERIDPRRSARARRSRAAASSCPAPFGPTSTTSSSACDVQLDVEVQRSELHLDAGTQYRVRGRAGGDGHEAAAPIGRAPNTRRPTTRQHRDRDREQHEAQHDGRAAVLSSARYTASGIVWVTPLKLPANVIVAPNSPSARAHVSAAPAASDGRDRGERDAAQHGPAARAERRARVFVARVERTERRLHGDHEERHRDERLGEDHALVRERRA